MLAKLSQSFALVTCSVERCYAVTQEQPCVAPDVHPQLQRTVLHEQNRQAFPATRPALKSEAVVFELLESRSSSPRLAQRKLFEASYFSQVHFWAWMVSAVCF